MNLDLSNMKSISIDGQEMKEVYIDGNLVWTSEKLVVTYGWDPVPGHPVDFIGEGDYWTDDGGVSTSMAGGGTCGLVTMNGDEFVFMYINNVNNIDVDLKNRPLSIDITLDRDYSSIVCNYEVFDAKCTRGTFTPYIEINGKRQIIDTGDSGSISTSGQNVSMSIGFSDYSEIGSGNKFTLRVSVVDFVCTE